MLRGKAFLPLLSRPSQAARKWLLKPRTQMTKPVTYDGDVSAQLDDFQLLPLNYRLFTAKGYVRKPYQLESRRQSPEPSSGTTSCCGTSVVRLDRLESDGLRICL